MTLQPTDAPVPATPEGGTQGQTTPPEPTISWEARYKGLQNVHQQVVENSRKQVEQLTGELEAAKSELMQIKPQVTAKETEVASQKAAADAAKIETAKLATKLQRYEILMDDEFVDLRSFEKAGLLPNPENATQELLRDGFSKFRSALGQVAQTGASAATSGATPPAPQTTPGNAAKSKNDLMNEAFAASKAGKTAEYDRLMQEVYKLG